MDEENERSASISLFVVDGACDVEYGNVGAAITYLLDDAERWKKKVAFDIDTWLTSKRRRAHSRSHTQAHTRGQHLLAHSQSPSSPMKSGFSLAETNAISNDTGCPALISSNFELPARQSLCEPCSLRSCCSKVRISNAAQLSQSICIGRHHV